MQVKAATQCETDSELLPHLQQDLGVCKAVQTKLLYQNNVQESLNPFNKAQKQTQPQSQKPLPPAAVQSTGKASSAVPGTPAHPALPGPSQHAQGSCR